MHMALFGTSLEKCLDLFSLLLSFRSIQSAVIVFRVALVTKSRPRRAGKNTENNTIFIYIYI